MLNIFYRISDKGYIKPKLPGITKEDCLSNLIECSDITSTKYYFFCDNCTPETLDMVKKISKDLNCTIHKSSLGNAGSLREALKAATWLDYKSPIYFVEDDYLHRGNINQLIEEGLSLAEYVTLFDHPDKYLPGYYNGGEISKVLKTNNTHWRYTASTCMTFATRSGNINKDFDNWRKYISGSHPHDHDVFTKGLIDSRLAVCIPGRAFHTDISVQLENQCNIEDWAINLACNILENKIKNLDIELVQEKRGLDKMKLLAAIYYNESR